MADGTSVIPAVSQGIPIEYIATVYGKFPNVVFAKEATGIRSAADLKGRKIGTPGRYGSGWIMLQALLGSAGLTTDDVEIVEYPDYTQRIAVLRGRGGCRDRVRQQRAGPAGAGRRRGDDPAHRRHHAAAGPRPDRRDRGARRETRRDRGVRGRYPQGDGRDQGGPRSRSGCGDRRRPGAGRRSRCAGRRVAATIDSWTGPVQAASGLGAIDEAGWAASIDYLKTLGLVPNPVKVDDLVRTDLLPGGG